MLAYSWTDCTLKMNGHNFVHFIIAKINIVKIDNVGL